MRRWFSRLLCRVVGHGYIDWEAFKAGRCSYCTEEKKRFHA